jgi:hypothetical protein
MIDLQHSKVKPKTGHSNTKGQKLTLHQVYVSQNRATNMLDHKLNQTEAPAQTEQ